MTATTLRDKACRTAIVQAQFARCRRQAGMVCVALCTAALWTVSPASAQSLQELYATARDHDATFLGALAQFDADQARAAQARAGVLPSVGLSAGAHWGDTQSNLATLERSSNSQNVAVAASHPLYRPANRLALEQAQRSLDIARSRLLLAEQDLIVRTAQAYFAVLAAQDKLTFVQAQKAAVAQQLAAAKRHFEVGTATITDTREAQAHFDLVKAQEIASENDLHIKRLALEQLVGRSQTQTWRLADDRPLPALSPEAVEQWVTRALAEHPQLRSANAALEIAQIETRRAEAAKGPTLDAVAQYQIARGPSQLGPYARNHNASVGVQFHLPLYSGGALQNRIAEAVAQQERARTEHEATRRGIVQATRAAYFGVQSGLVQVKALQAAQASSQSALEANQLGYQVGVRINIDVLNAQSQWFQTKANLSQARVDVLVGKLRLRQASGVLSAADLQPLDALLLPASK